MKKILIGSALGIVLGAGAVFGLAQIPEVGAVIGGSTSSGSIVENDDKIIELENKNNQLNSQIATLNSDLSIAKEQIVEKDNLIKLKNDEISKLTSEKSDLQSQLDKAISEKEQLEGLVGSDTSQLFSTISSLTTQLEEKTTALSIATAELDQLRVDKETLINRVSELETRLSEVEEELANYKSLDNIEVLDISNFEGKWYIDGTFQDYYIIENGVVTHNASEDIGVIKCLNNQVYLFMNKDGSIPVNLSVDGNSFLLEDGTIYSKFYINTLTSVVSNNTDFIGSYSCNNFSIKLNSDNTLLYSDGNDNYYGSYVSTAVEKNVGGNICVKHSIIATINIKDVQVTRYYEFSTLSKILTDVDYNIEYSKVYGVDDATLLFASGKTSIDTSTFTKGYYKVIVKSKNKIVINPGMSISLKFAFVNTQGYSIDAKLLYVNGTTVNGRGLLNLYNTSDEIIYTDTLLLYFHGFEITSYVNQHEYDKCFISDMPDFDIVSVENFGVDMNAHPLYGEFNDVYNVSSISETNKILCSQVDDYINGSYLLNNNSLVISSDGATITPTDSESIVATSCSVTAKTDGYDIYQTATIKYITVELVDEVETEVLHTIVIDYKNNNVISSTFDGVESDIIKN